MLLVAFFSSTTLPYIPPPRCLGACSSSPPSPPPPQVLGRLLRFRDYYLEQRRLQVTNDLQPPHKFLESYQPYLAQVRGRGGVAQVRCCQGSYQPCLPRWGVRKAGLA